MTERHDVDADAALRATTRAVTDDAPPTDGSVRAARLRSRRAKRRGGRPATHGLQSLQSTLRALGTRALDGRGPVSKQLRAWRADLVADLGGDLSAQQTTLVELAVRQRLLVESVDVWLLEQATMIGTDRDGRPSLVPVLKERQQLADGLARYMTALGLERRAKHAGDLLSQLAAVTPGASEKGDKAGAAGAATVVEVVS